MLIAVLKVYNLRLLLNNIDFEQKNRKMIKTQKEKRNQFEQNKNYFYFSYCKSLKTNIGKTTLINL